MTNWWSCVESAMVQHCWEQPWRSSIAYMHTISYWHTIMIQKLSSYMYTIPVHRELWKTDSSISLWNIGPIFKILSLVHSAGNLQQNGRQSSQCTSSVSPQYLVKCWFIQKLHWLKAQQRQIVWTQWRECDRSRRATNLWFNKSAQHNTLSHGSFFKSSPGLKRLKRHLLKQTTMQDSATQNSCWITLPSLGSVTKSYSDY